MPALNAEYISCSEISLDAKWLLQLHQDIHGKDASPLLINCDNQGLISHITTGIMKVHTKHSDICSHNSQDIHACKIVDYSDVHTNEDDADILTISLTKDKHDKSTKAMGLWCGRFKVGLKVVSLFFWTCRFPCLSMDSHPQAKIVRFSYSVLHRFKEATIGINLFVVSLRIWFLAPQCLARGGVLHDRSLSAVTRDESRMARDEPRMTVDCRQPEEYIHRCVHMHSHVYSYLYGLVALLDYIQLSFSNITIGTGYATEPPRAQS
jgi:hypothetical protein